MCGSLIILTNIVYLITLRIFQQERQRERTFGERLKATLLGP